VRSQFSYEYEEAPQQDKTLQQSGLLNRQYLGAGAGLRDQETPQRFTTPPATAPSPKNQSFVEKMRRK
jgi:hypothetical protein